MHCSGPKTLQEMAAKCHTRPTALLRLSRCWPWLWDGCSFHGVPGETVPARAPALPGGVLCGDGSGVSDGNVEAFLEVDEFGMGSDVRTVGCNLCAFLDEARKVLGIGNPEEVGVECVNVVWGSLE